MAREMKREGREGMCGIFEICGNASSGMKSPENRLLTGKEEICAAKNGVKITS